MDNKDLILRGPSIHGYRSRVMVITGSYYYKFLMIILMCVAMTGSCSGTVWTATNDSTLSNAITNAQSGDYILLSEGTYGKITLTTTDLHILGYDPDKVVFDLSGENIELKASGCTLEDISIINSPRGVEVKADDCTIRGCIFDGVSYDYGIYILGDNVLFEDNIIKNATCASIALYCFGDTGTYKKNTFIDNDCAALCIYGGKDLIVTENNFENNSYGLYLGSSGSANIFLNNFRSNTADAVAYSASSSVVLNSVDSCSYTYNEANFTGILGNYWDKYDGTDDNADGIGDTPYVVLDSIVEDNYPLLTEFEDLVSEEDGLPELIPISVDPEKVVAEQPNRIRVTIKNIGDSDADVFSILLMVDGMELSEKVVPSLSKDESKDVAFIWFPAIGSHNVTVIVDDELNVEESDETNNELTQIIPASSSDPDLYWYQFHKDAQHTGFYPGTVSDTNEQLWVSDGINAVTSSSPVVAEGKVFVNCGEKYAGDSGSSIVALDQYTGEYIGTYEYESTSSTRSWPSPCYYEGNISCSRPDSVNGGNMIISGRVYVGDYGGGNYHCSYESNGTEIWSFGVEGSAMGTPAYSDGMVYLTSCVLEDSGDIYCVDAENGSEIWHVSTRDDACSTPSIYGDIVYVTTYNWVGSGQIYAIDKYDGTILWKNNIQRTDSCPACAYGNVYLSGGCEDYAMFQTYCFNATTGETVWQTEKSWTGLGSWTYSPVVADGKVFVGKADGTYSYGSIYALDAFTGETIWTNSGGGATPAISDGIVYTIGSDGKVYAYGNSNYDLLPDAVFSADPTTGEYPLLVTFTDSSINATSWEWDFENDGIIDSTEQDPVHWFNSSGTYNVSLKVSNAEGSDTEVKMSYISVTEQSSADWNPWNDLDSDEGTMITGDEFQVATKCWLTLSPVPETGVELTGDRFQEIIHDWLVQ